MKKENWLDPVSVRDAVAFSHYIMNIFKLKDLEELEDLSYGKLFKFEGFKKDELIDHWNSQKKYISLCLGEFGPIDADPNLEKSFNDLNQLFNNDDELVNIYLSWIMLVAKKNGDRKINGLTYLESFSNACNKNIDLVKSSQIRAIENEAEEKKKCVSSFVSQISKKTNTKETPFQK